MTGGSLWYAQIETFDQLGHDPSPMNSQPINDRKAENERWAIDSDDGANEFHGATEDSLATMTCATLPVQERLGQYEYCPAVVQIPTTSTVVDPK